MRTRGETLMTRSSAAIAVAAATVLTATLSAGGWAVITVKQLPSRIEAGKPVSLAYTVRQHGLTLLPGLPGSISAVAGATKIAADATGGGSDGEYAASLTFPRAGEWVVTIRSGFPGSDLTLLPLAVVEPGAEMVRPATASLGRQLFVAKGCVACHANDLSSANRSMAIGPKLIAHKYQDDFLAKVLMNPAGTLPPRNDFVQMPNLALAPDEVAALVAFINAPAATASR
jgi:cytochrome c551/c552